MRLVLAIWIAVSAMSLGSAAEPNDYSKPETWLCRPGRTAGDACSTADLSATVVAASGKRKLEKWKPDPKPPIDCFYVYPTVSLDPTPNSDMIAGPEETNVVAHQFARFASHCRPYAPLYRQMTLTGLRARLSGKAVNIDRKLAYQDVLAAWNYYLDHDNKGRGVVLIGHSQGSSVLLELLKNEIDSKPAQAKLVSALLMGTNVPVPQGKDVGGAFQNIPLCRSAAQTGCVVSYVSFRANEPPPKNALFGRVPGKEMMAACVNPAALSGGSGPLHAYFGAAGKKDWVTPAPAEPIQSRFVSVPGLLTGECVSNESGSYLAVTVHADPKDPRTDEIPGDVIAAGVKQPNWGLHLVDVNLAMGDLVDLVAKQAKAFVRRHPAAGRQ